jgi:hypothetical protein
MWRRTRKDACGSAQARELHRSRRRKQPIKLRSCPKVNRVKITAELGRNIQQFRATETTLARACGLTDRFNNHKQEKIYLISRERRGQFLRLLAVLSRNNN